MQVAGAPGNYGQTVGWMDRRQHSAAPKAERLPTPFQSSPKFSSSVRTCAQIDELTLCQIDVGSRLLVTERSMSHLEGRSLLGVCMVLCGAGEIAAGERSLELRSGSLTLFDASRPFQILLQLGTSCLILTLPAATLRNFGIAMGDVLPATFNGATGPGLLLCGALRALPEVAQTLDTASSSATAIVAAIENFVISTFAYLNEDHGTVAQPCGRIDQIKAYVLAHLREPDLSVDRIANALHISASSVHRAFSSEPCSVSSWIWSMRLDGARRDLCDGMQSHRNITDVAFSWGFNDTAHFSRSFRSRFGHSPRQQRDDCQARRQGQETA